MDLSRCSIEQAANMECNIFGLTQFDNRSSYFGDGSPFPQGVGYAVVVAGGVFFAVFCSLLVWLDQKFGGSVYDNAHFNTAGRSIKTGLICSDVISHWTWNSVFLFTPTLYYFYGWFAVVGGSIGSSFAILLFGRVGMELKEKAPTATTMMQVIRKRWGITAHLVFLLLMLLTNWFVTVTNILGGCQVTTAMTGMNIYAGAILIPFGIILFSAFGGLKATFTSSYVHTCIIMVTMLIFAFRFFTVDGYSGNVGNMRQIFENTGIMAQVKPVTGSYGLAGNRHGSYLTFFSAQGLCYMIYILFANTPIVFNDQAYWQTCVAGKATSVVYGFALSSILSFPTNWLFAISLGGAAIALDLPISADEASESLVVPAASIVLLGKTGGALLIVIVFMATTSAVSAELVGVSSLLTYDVWKLYLRPKASPKELLIVSRFGVCLWGAVGALSVCIVTVLNFNFNWFYLVIGVFAPPAVPALFCALFWDRVSAAGAIISSITGIVCSVFVWLYVSYRMVGDVSITSTQQTLPITTSTVTALGVATAVIVLWSWVFPVKYDWAQLKTINLEEADSEGIQDDWTKIGGAELKRAKKIFAWVAAVFSFLLIVAWPLLSLPAGDWSYGYFAFNVVLALVWGCISSVLLIGQPLAESRQEMWDIVRNLCTWTPVQKQPLLAQTTIADGGVRTLPKTGNGTAQPAALHVAKDMDVVHMLE